MCFSRLATTFRSVIFAATADNKQQQVAQYYRIAKGDLKTATEYAEKAQSMFALKKLTGAVSSLYCCSSLSFLLSFSCNSIFRSFLLLQRSSMQ
jgi:hypothetical protein